MGKQGYNGWDVHRVFSSSNFDTIRLMVQKSERNGNGVYFENPDVDDRNSGIKDQLLNWCSPDF